MNQENALNIEAQSRYLRSGRLNGKNSIIGRRGRIAFYYVYTAFTLGAATALLIPQSAAGRGSNLIFSIAWVIMHAISFIIFLGFRRHYAPNLMIAAAIGAYIILSAIWSASPSDTLIYGSMVAGNIVTAYMISQDLNLKDFMLMSARVILLLAILGMIAGLLGYSQALYFDHSQRPTIIGTHPIRGFFNHKVPAALFATIGTIACLSCYRGQRRALAVLCLGFFVILTGSSTGLVIFPTALFLFMAFSRLRRMRKGKAITIIWIGIIFGSLVASILISYMDIILNALGRDPTLTGRTLLWQWGIQTWIKSPMIGWGFDGYFNGPDAGAISAEIKRFENYDVPHFHQSYIQTAVDLGIPGLLTLVLIQISIINRAWRYMRKEESAIGVSIMSIIIIMIISAFSMFIFLTYNHYATLAMFVMYFALRRLTSARLAIVSRYHL